jgi:hypothetical protein
MAASEIEATRWVSVVTTMSEAGAPGKGHSHAMPPAEKPGLLLHRSSSATENRSHRGSEQDRGYWMGQRRDDNERGRGTGKGA